MSRVQTTDRTMAQVVQAAADQFGGQVAIKDGAVALTYNELNAARLQVSAACHAAGLVRGDRIAIWAPNVYQWILAAIGAQSVGIVLVPINTRWKGSEAAYALNTSRAKLLFTVGEFLGQSYTKMLEDEDLPHLETTVLLQGEAVGCLSWDHFVAAGATVAEAEVLALSAAVSPEDPLDIGFTSGTTGAPKGVVTGHAQNIRVYETWSATVGLRSTDNYLIISPFFHSFGYKAGWLAAIIRGARILPVLTFDLDEVLAQIERDKVTMLPGAPTIYQSILAHPRREEYDLSSFRLAVTGAAPVPVELVNQMRSVLQFETVVTAYGLTESCGTVSICEADDPAEVISSTSGKPIAGVEVIIVDSQGDELPRGEAGEIWVRGYNVMQGYLDNPEETAKAINSDGWLMTGDVGVMDAAGYIDITDRIKDMFIVGGFNCYPAEIENALCSLPGVAQAAVIGVPDERMGEVANAWIIVHPDAELDSAAIIAWCREKMANYKVPRVVHLVDSLPTNASGKVLKTELKAMVASA
ncbi:fatty acid--CoA ligase [Halieaceae bacterium IMCC14734]|uniref:Fatty acid--CoA ligase n=1 Tax=Candidatus Litorirhabdus singularis TaxID=2518993 RepID=A0ABT3TLV4_9GAMM|nr:FadD3 family acyl-CoA ligase [Candidatus Litorirhabdus singularis]MCX2983241.1 fatty acid--CoA ligase [Candidatus Litorirhabdus singularis]